MGGGKQSESPTKVTNICSGLLGQGCFDGAADEFSSHNRAQLINFSKLLSQVLESHVLCAPVAADKYLASFHLVDTILTVRLDKQVRLSIHRFRPVGTQNDSIGEKIK